MLVVRYGLFYVLPSLNRLLGYCVQVEVEGISVLLTMDDHFSSSVYGTDAPGHRCALAAPFMARSSFGRQNVILLLSLVFTLWLS